MSLDLTVITGINLMWLVSFFMSVINLLFKILPCFYAFVGLNPIQACIFFGLEGYSSVLHIAQCCILQFWCREDMSTCRA